MLASKCSKPFQLGQEERAVPTDLMSGPLDEYFCLPFLVSSTVFSHGVGIKGWNSLVVLAR